MCLASLIHWWTQQPFWFDLTVLNNAVQLFMSFCSFSKHPWWTSLGGFCCLGFQLAEVLMAAYSLLVVIPFVTMAMRFVLTSQQFEGQVKGPGARCILSDGQWMPMNWLVFCGWQLLLGPASRCALFWIKRYIKQLESLEQWNWRPSKRRKSWFVWKNIAYWYLEIGGSDSLSASFL